MGAYDKIIELARAEIGTTEQPKNSNKTKYGKWYGLDGQPYCMMFVQYICAKAGHPLPYKTASCGDLLRWYQKNKPEAIKHEGKKGYIVMYNFGHTGFFERNDGKNYMVAVEGNTSPTNMGSQNNGGGVYERLRSKSTVECYIDFLGEDGEDYMTGEEIFKELMAYLNELPESSWSREEGALDRISKKTGKGGKKIMSKDNPRAFVTREQLAAVLDRGEK